MFAFNATCVNLEDRNHTEAIRILIAISVTSTVASILSLLAVCFLYFDRPKVHPET